MSELAKGTKIEHEHKPTYDKIKKYIESHGKMPSLDQYAKWTASDHIKELPGYYTELIKMEDKLKKQALSTDLLIRARDKADAIRTDARIESNRMIKDNNIQVVDNAISHGQFTPGDQAKYEKIYQTDVKATNQSYKFDRAASRSAHLPKPNIKPSIGAKGIVGIAGGALAIGALGFMAGRKKEASFTDSLYRGMGYHDMNEISAKAGLDIDTTRSMYSRIRVPNKYLISSDEAASDIKQLYAAHKSYFDLQGELMKTKPGSPEEKLFLGKNQKVLDERLKGFATLAKTTSDKYRDYKSGKLKANLEPMKKEAFDSESISYDKKTDQYNYSYDWTNRDKSHISGILKHFVPKNKPINYQISQADDKYDWYSPGHILTGTSADITKQINSKTWDSNKGSWGTISFSKPSSEVPQEHKDYAAKFDSSSVSKKQQSHRGALIGSVLGGSLGAAAMSPSKSLKQMAFGAGIGAVTGFGIGATVDQFKKAYDMSDASMWVGLGATTIGAGVGQIAGENKAEMLAQDAILRRDKMVKELGGVDQFMKYYRKKGRIMGGMLGAGAAYGISRMIGRHSPPLTPEVGQVHDAYTDPLLYNK